VWTQQHSVQGTSGVGTVFWATWLDGVQHVGKKKTRYMWKCNVYTPGVLNHFKATAENRREYSR